MSSDLEALVGHLFVVGGRSISTASPGSIAMPPPRRAARGRDADTLFALISLSVEQRQPASFYEQLSQQLAHTYFGVPGSVTSALRGAVAALNDSLLATNANLPEPVRVGMACAILREQELILALSGPARCFLVREGVAERLPPDDELMEPTRLLGADAEPEVRLYRHEVNAGDFLILADSSLNRLKDATLRQVVESGEVDIALNNLRGVAGEFTSAQVIQFVTPLTEPAPAAQPGHKAVSYVTDRPMEVGQAADLSPLRKLGRDAALGLAGVVGSAQTLAEKVLPGQAVEKTPQDRVPLSTAMQIGVVAAVAVLVALLTTVVYRWRGQTSQYAQLVREAQSEVEQARAGSADQAIARPHWETAIFLLNQAAQIRAPGTEIAALRTEALAALDTYDHVTRVNPVLLREYEPGTYLKGPVVQGLNLYLIDTTADILYREDLDETSTSLVNHDPQIITRQGDQVSNQVVGGLIDLTWMEDGGVPQRNVLAVLTRNGLLITYSPSWDATAVVLPGFEAWQDPRAIAVYNRDLYILDAGANEIWRYQAAEDSYNSLPQRYFTDVIPQLGDAIDMEIDTNGNVYVLHSAGQISKYFFGREQTFAFDGLPQPIVRPTALTLTLSLFNRTFLIADPDGGRLYETALTGTFLANYKDADDALFDALSGAFSQDRPPMIFVTAGNRLYAFPRP